MSDEIQEAEPIRNEKGQFQQGYSGNPSGRPAGTRNKLTETFLKDVLGAWLENGKEALDKMSEEKPGDFVRAVASIIDKDETIRHEIEGNLDFSLVSPRMAAMAVMEVLARARLEKAKDGGEEG